MDFFKSKQNIKLPDDFEDPEKMRNYLKEFIKIKSLVKVGWRLGLGNPIDLFNKVFAYYYPEGNPEVEKGDDNVDVTYTEYLGVPVKMYIPKARPEDKGKLGMVFYHGGGYCIGSADEMDGLTRRLSTDCCMVIASVNYRLAPDHVYPAAIDDCMKATKHFFSICHEQYGVNPERVIIAGDSSGGHLSASVSSRLCREKFQPKPRLQVLIYPVIQTVDLSTPSYTANADDPYLCRWLMASFLLSYVVGRKLSRRQVELASQNRHVTREILQHFRAVTGRSADLEGTGSKVDKELSEMCSIMATVDFNPIFESDFSILPDTYIIKCSQDVLASEIDCYAEKIRQTQKVTVVVKEYQALHAMLDYLDLKVAERAICDLVNYINEL